MASIQVSPRLARAMGASAIAAALLAGAPAYATNLLTNGSFEDTTNFTNQGNDTMTVPLGDSTTMPGWTVINNSIAWIGPTNPFGVTASPAGGSYFLDLTGYHDGSPYGGVQQTIATVNGASYLLTFDLGSTSLYGVQDGVHVTAAGASGDFLSTNNGTETNKWESESLSFVATGASTTISVLGNAGFAAIGLDNASLVQTSGGGNGVPEPATWGLMLLGFGGLGATLRLRRRTLAA